MGFLPGGMKAIESELGPISAEYYAKPGSSAELGKKNHQHSILTLALGTCSDRVTANGRMASEAARLIRKELTERKNKRKHP
jgi:hypothetical protein